MSDIRGVFWEDKGLQTFFNFYIYYRSRQNVIMVFLVGGNKNRDKQEKKRKGKENLKHFSKIEGKNQIYKEHFPQTFPTFFQG